MNKIFVSHSSANNAEAEFLKNWLHAEGWSDLFLDFDEKLGIKAGSRWQHELGLAMRQCDAMLILLSPEWVGSHNCRAEFNTASMQHKPIVGCIVKDLPYADIPVTLSAEWQMVNLTSGDRDVERSVQLHGDASPQIVAFSSVQLRRLKAGLQAIGLDASYFPWPPKTDPNRSPYPGLAPLGETDTGIYFGRDGKIGDALRLLRRIRTDGRSTMMAILGASGAGKSSFMRAGLIPRLQRDDRHFLVLPTVRPMSKPLSGNSSSLIRSLLSALRDSRIRRSLDEVETAVTAGSASVHALLMELCKARPPDVFSGDDLPLPSIVLPIDQGEELIFTDPKSETAHFFDLLQELLSVEQSNRTDDLQLIVMLTIRTDQYDRFQSLPQKVEIKREPFSLPPMPIGEYGEVIRGPARRYMEAQRDRRPEDDAAGGRRHGPDAGRGLEIEEALIDALLVDIQVGGARDSLPLLAFTMQRLFARFGDGGRLSFEGYERLGRIRGSIAASIERVMELADQQPGKIPGDHTQRMTLMRRGLIPWLAGIDPETQQPRRRVARLSEIPEEARPLIDIMTEERLLSSDRDVLTGEVTIEPAHEALLRQWVDLDEWLQERQADFSAIDAIRRATLEWTANAKKENWLAHYGSRLEEAEQSAAKDDFRKLLEPTDLEYLEACRDREDQEKQNEIAALREKQRILRSRLVFACVAGIVFIAAAGISSLLYLRAEDQRNHTAAALDVARSREALNGDNIEHAALLGLSAFEKVQGREQRSAFLTAATEISPNLNLTYQFEAMTPLAIAWTPGNVLGIATREGRLLTVSIDKKRDIDGPGHSFAAGTEASDGMAAHVTALYPAFGGMVGMLADGRLLISAPDSDSRDVPIRDRVTTSLKPRGPAVDTDSSGRTVVAVDDNGGALIYDCPSSGSRGLPLCTIRTLRDLDIRSVAVARDGTKVLGGNATGGLLDLTKPAAVPVMLTSFPTPADALKLSSDGRYLAAASGSGEIYLSDMSGAEAGPPIRIGNDGASVPGLAWSPNRDELAYICRSNIICLRNTRQPPDLPAIQLVGHTKPVLQIAWSPDGEYLASIATDNSLRIWQRTADERIRRQVSVSSDALASLAIDRTSGRIAAGDNQGGIWTFEKNTAPQRWTAEGMPAASVSSLDWNAQGRLAALFDKSGFIAGEPGDTQARYIPVADAGEMRTLTWVGTSRIALLAVASSMVEVVTAEAGNADFSLPRIGETVTPYVARGDREGAHLFVGYVDGSIRSWDVDTRAATIVQNAAATTEQKPLRNSASNLAFDATHKQIAFGHQSGNVIVSTPEKNEDRIFETGNRELKIVSFSPSGDHLAALAPSGQMYIWRLDDNSEPVLSVRSIPARSRANALPNGQKKSVWLDWYDDSHVLIATGAGEVQFISLDEKGWSERVRGILRYSN